MKPIIIWMEDKDNIKLTKEELEKMLEQAYNQGYEFGYSAGRGSPTITPYPTWIDTYPKYNPCDYTRTTSIGGTGTTSELKD